MSDEMAFSLVSWVTVGLFGLTMSQNQCSMPVPECIALGNATCMGSTLPYPMTSISLAWDSRSADEIQQKLELWSRLRNVPRCWEVIQPLLCSVYMPKCEETASNDSVIHTPSKELCELTRGPCKVVEAYAESGWPNFLKCNASHFRTGCIDELQKVRFNTSGHCAPPLVKTDDANSWYGDVEGCGIQCENPLFTKAEHDRMHTLIAVCGSICMVSTLYTVLTFLIDWKAANRYPALILFFINLCFFVGSVGWMAQFLPGARRDIVCRKDDTMRHSEPQIGSGESVSCAVVFVLVYYFMMAGVMWFMILAYAWHLMFRAFGVKRDVIENKRGHFHLVAWTFPLVLTIVCLALTQIDGDSVSGICFVGYLKHEYRGGFVLFPIGIVIVVGLCFLSNGLYNLCKIRRDSPGLISDKASARIRDAIIKLGVFAFSALSCVIITFSVHVYIFTNERQWQKSFEEYLICEANVTGLLSNVTRTKACTIESTPNLVAMGIHIFVYFGAGIIMSMWSWNRASLEAWRRFIKVKILRKEETRPVKLKKHQVIARAFNKRRAMNQGRLSLSFYSTHDDPMGMKFDMNSVTSNEMSSAWAAAIPRLIERRGGVAQHRQRRFSDSDVQSLKSSIQQVSAIIESHGLSIESHSQLSHPSGSEPTYEERKPKKKIRRRKRRRNRVNPIQIPSMFTETSSNGGDPASLDRKSSFAGMSSDTPRPSIPSSVVSSTNAPVAYTSHRLQQGAANPAYVADEPEMECEDIEDLDLDGSDMEERPASQITVRSSDTDAMSMGRCDSQATVRSSDSEAMSYKCCSSQSTVRSSDTDAMSVKDFVIPSPTPEQGKKRSPSEESSDDSRYFKPIHVPRGEITNYIPHITAVQATTTYSMFNMSPGRMSGMPDVENPVWQPNIPKQPMRHHRGRTRKPAKNYNNNNTDIESMLPGTVMEMKEFPKPIVVKPKRHARTASTKIHRPEPQKASAFKPVASSPQYKRAVATMKQHRDKSPSQLQSPPARSPKERGVKALGPRPGSPRPTSLSPGAYKLETLNPLALITPRRHGRKSRKVKPIDESHA